MPLIQLQRATVAFGGPPVLDAIDLVIERGERLALHYARVLFDDGVRNRMAPSLARLQPEPFVALHPRDAGAFAVSAGDVVRVVTEHGAVELPVRIDPTLAEGAAYVPANLAATAVLGAAPSVTIEPSAGDGG